MRVCTQISPKGALILWGLSTADILVAKCVLQFAARTIVCAHSPLPLKIEVNLFFQRKREFFRYGSNSGHEQWVRKATPGISKAGTGFLPHSGH